MALNDAQDTAVLAGVAYDVDTGERFFNVEADRRLGKVYVLELRVRLFGGADSTDATHPIVGDDYVQLQLSRYF